MNMPKWIKKGFRFAGLGLFQILILFWLAKLYYSARGYYVAGTKGMLGALLQGTPVSSDPNDWAHPPRWDLLVMRLVGIAAITVTLGILNRRTLAKFWRDLRHPPSRSDDLRTPHRAPNQK
jgi:hypothetical protein